jgi:hypothetical protein
MCGEKRHGQAHPMGARAGECRTAVGNALCKKALVLGKTSLGKPSSGNPVKIRLHRKPVALLFADTELGDYGLIPFRVVLLQVVEQAATPAYHHEKSAARAMVFLVRFEVVRQLTNAFAQQCDLNFGTSGIGRVRAIRINYGLFLLSG